MFTSFPGKSSFEHGIVNHALCAAMKTLLKVRMLIFITNMIARCTILVPRLILNVIRTSNLESSNIIFGTIKDCEEVYTQVAKSKALSQKKHSTFLNPPVALRQFSTHADSKYCYILIISVNLTIIVFFCVFIFAIINKIQ